MAYGELKDLTRITASDKIMCNIAKNPKHNGYQKCLASMVYKDLKKNSCGAVRNENIKDKGINERCDFFSLLILFK